MISKKKKKVIASQFVPFSGPNVEKFYKQVGVDLFFFFGDHPNFRRHNSKCPKMWLNPLRFTQAKSGICDEKSGTRPQKAGLSRLKRDVW